MYEPGNVGERIMGREGASTTQIVTLQRLEEEKSRIVKRRKEAASKIKRHVLTHDSSIGN